MREIPVEEALITLGELESAQSLVSIFRNPKIVDQQSQIGTEGKWGPKVYGFPASSVLRKELLLVLEKYQEGSESGVSLEILFSVDLVLGTDIKTAIRRDETHKVSNFSPLACITAGRYHTPQLSIPPSQQGKERTLDLGTPAGRWIAEVALECAQQTPLLLGEKLWQQSSTSYFYSSSKVYLHCQYIYE